MMRSLNLSVLITLLVGSGLHGWNARFAPEESDVTWPAVEDEFDRSVILSGIPDIPEANLLYGLVQEAGAASPTDFMARIDEGTGEVEWSRRVPAGPEHDYFGLTLVAEDTLVTAFQTGTEEAPQDRIGRFNPEASFSQRWGYTLPGIVQDPLNPLGNGLRSYQVLEGGKLALVQIEGNEVKVLMLDADGAESFRKVYTLPAGGDFPFPIPGFGLSYNFATIWQAENGDYFLTTNGIDLASQSSTAVVLRLGTSGQILWQASVEVPGASAFTTPLPNGNVVVAGGMGGLSITSSIAVIDPNGNLVFGRQVPDFILSNNAVIHYNYAGQLLFTGTIPTVISQTAFEADAGILILSDSGEKVAETAYDKGSYDQIFHIASNEDGLYFEFIGIDVNNEGETTRYTHGVLGRTDDMLNNWTTRSYLEELGPSAAFSTIFVGEGTPLLAHRDATQSWIYINKLDADLLPVGDCEVMVDGDLVFYDPDIDVQPFTPDIDTSAVTEATWVDAPALNPDSFTLVDTPLTSEEICDDGGGSGSAGPLTQGEWTQLDFGWVYGETDSWGISTYMGYVYVADLPYVYQVDLGWAYLVASNGADHYFYTWDHGWILINEGFGGFYYVYATDDYTQQIPQP